MKTTQKALILMVSTLVISQMLVVIPCLGITPNSSDISPTIFSPGDGNGINDTTTITVTYTASQTLYVNVFNQSSVLVAEDRVMTENPSGTYKYIWNGKNDSDGYVSEGTYTIRISDNPAVNGDTIGTVQVDITPPSSPSLSINGGATYTTSRNVNLTIGATGATKMKVSNYANFSGATWENYATSKSWQLTENDGGKTVYINFRDAAGANISTSDSITLDTTIADPSLSINSGASYTNDRNVTLTINANDATQMKIDNDTAFSNMSNWINKANTYNFTLPVTGGDGVRTVYLRVRDDAGNTKTTSDSITLDTQAPTNLSISINGGASYTNSANVTLTLSANGGPSTIYLSNNGSVWNSYSYTTSKYWILTSTDGTKTVYYKTADVAGNNATQISASITLDTIPPSTVTLTSPSSGATVSTQTPTFSWSNPNPSGTKNFYIEILQSGVVKQSSYTNATTTNYTAETLAPGTYQWRITVYDMANNSATTSQLSFTISISGLAIPSPTYPTSAARVNSSAPDMIRLRWSQVTGQGTIYYDYKYGNSSTNLTNQGSTTNLYTDIPDGTYNNGDQVYWSVRARNTTNTSSYSSVKSFTVDTEPPVLYIPSINSGNSHTSSTSVTVSLSATGASWMMVSENANFSGASWESYSTSKSFTLSSGDGTKTIYFKAKDNAVGDQGSTGYANINSSATSDTIVLDTTAPTISNGFPSSSTTETTPEISADLSDSGSGIDTSSVIITVDGINQTVNATITSIEVTYEPSSALSIGSHTVNITASDNVSNTGYLQWSFTITTGGDGDGDGDGDGIIGGLTTPPITISDIQHTPTTITNTDIVNVSATITATNGVYKARVYYSYGGTSDSAKMSNTSHNYYASIKPFPEGATVTYYIHVTDNNAATQDSSNYSFTVEDSNGPTITIVSPSDGSKIVDRTPTIKASYSDSSGVDTSSVRLSIDNNDVSADATITATTVSYTPSSPLSYSLHEIIVEVTDNSGNTATETWSFTIQSDVIEITETIEEILEGETEIITLEDYETSIKEIKITAANNLENVTVHLKTMGEKPDAVTLPTKTVYIYLELEINAEADDISSVTITFKVEQSWFEANNIDKEAVILLRYHNNEWQELTTTKSSEDDAYVYYEAVTPGLSIFAIVGSELGTDVTEPGIPWLFIIIAILAVIILVIAFLFKSGYLFLEEKNSKETKKRPGGKNNKKDGK
jgi:PGF-pre-PGF domain-containing protein